MIVSSLRLALVGLFLFMATSVRVEAAEPPSAGPLYLLAAGAGSCGAGAVVLSEQRSLGVRNMVTAVARYYEANSVNRIPVSVNAFSSVDVPLDGSCVTANATGADGVVHVVSFWLQGVIESPPEAGTISDYSMQDIIVLSTSFIVLCIGWSCGLKS